MANKQPVAFGVAMTILFMVVMIATAVFVTLATRLTIGHSTVNHEYSRLVIGMGSRLLTALFFILLLFRIGWLRTVGFATPASLRHWFIIVVPTLYLGLAASYLFTRSLSIDWSDPVLIVLNIGVAFAVGLVEETVYRGIVLHAFLRVWGHTFPGILKAVLLSSLFFGAIHLLNLFSGTSLTFTLSQFIYAILLGVMFSAIVLYTQSIWPAIVFHWLIDAAVSVNLIGKSEREPTLGFAIQLVAIIVPLGIYGLYLLRSHME